MASGIEMWSGGCAVLDFDLIDKRLAAMSCGFMRNSQSAIVPIVEVLVSGTVNRYRESIL